MLVGSQPFQDSYNCFKCSILQIYEKFEIMSAISPYVVCGGEEKSRAIGKSWCGSFVPKKPSNLCARLSEYFISYR